MNRRHLLSLAPLLALPEPRRVYSFLDGWRDPVELEHKRLIELAEQRIRKISVGCWGSPAYTEVDKERIMRAIRDSFDAVVLPPNITVECLNTGTIAQDRRLDMRVTIQRPIYSAQFGWV